MKIWMDDRYDPTLYFPEGEYVWYNKLSNMLSDLFEEKLVDAVEFNLDHYMDHFGLTGLDVFHSIVDDIIDNKLPKLKRIIVHTSDESLFSKYEVIFNSEEIFKRNITLEYKQYHH